MEFLERSEASQVINNVRSDIQAGFESGVIKTKGGRILSSGLEDLFNDQIDDMIMAYGEQAVGIALNEAKKAIKFRESALYHYKPKDEVEQELQDKAEEYMRSEFENLIKTADDLINNDETELEGGERDQYRKERKRIQSKISRAIKRGLSIPRLARIVGLPTRKDFFDLLSFEREWFG